ncbi:unnamed protein product, partial [Closterium sp. Naga37s-1]
CEPCSCKVPCAKATCEYTQPISRPLCPFCPLLPPLPPPPRLPPVPSVPLLLKCRSRQYEPCSCKGPCAKATCEYTQPISRPLCPLCPFCPLCLLSLSCSNAAASRQYEPCSCKGPCAKATCECIMRGCFCEKYCGCAQACKNRFRGCNCAKSHCSSRLCPCFAASRECDPDLCRNCWVDCGDNREGAVLPLPPPVREKNYDCHNMRLLLRQHQHILLGPSDVAGWGAFLKKEVAKNDYVGEYTGELISEAEAERRGKIYDRINCSFLFDLNKKYVLDAFRRGNKLKFANHSLSPNCHARVIMSGESHAVAVIDARMGASHPRGRSARISADSRRSAMVPGATGARTRFPPSSPSAHPLRTLYPASAHASARASTRASARASAHASARASAATPFTSMMSAILFSSLLFAALLVTPAIAQGADAASTGCTVSASAVSCPAGFAGRAFALNAQAYIAGAGRENALVLGAGGTADKGSAGSAFTTAALSPPLGGGGSFSARFTFQLEGQNEADVATGLAFVMIGGTNTAVGSPSLAGYGGAAFDASVAVVLSGRPPISAGVLSAGPGSGAALPTRVQQHAWVDYDASSTTLRLFLSGSSPTKPAAPVLSEPVDLPRVLGLAPDGSCPDGIGEAAVGGGGCLFVGFTGGSAAVDTAELAAAGVVAGGELIQTIGPGPNFPIWLDTTTNAAGCAFSIPSLSLSLGTEAGAVAFEAAFSFSFAASADYNSWGSRGLAFVLTAGEKTACGRSSGSNIGYGSAPNASFAKSIAVELRARPTACVAVVVGGQVAGDNCADSDAMALLPPSQAFTLNEAQHVWLSYDGSSGALQVFVSPGAASKPSAPVLVAPVDVAPVLGGTAGLSVSVGFTGASWWTWVDDLEDHIIHSLSFQAVPPGSQQSLPPSPAPTTCHLAPSNTRLTCLGFAGHSAFRLNGYAHVGPAPSFPLVLDTGGTAGSALTLADMALSLDSSTSAATAGVDPAATAAAVAFEAAFAFSVWTETSYGYRGSRGLTFVISSGDKTACGSSDMGAIGYGGAAPGAFNGSVAVELRSGPTSCVAVVVNGVASGDNCAAADHMTGLTGNQEIALSERQHAWVAYDGTSQSLEVYLGGSDGLKPEEPVLRASLDLVAVIGATSASVGFTAGTWWWGCGDTDDHHLIHSFTFNTVAPGFLPGAQPTQAPTCETTASSLNCVGFAGSTPFDLNGYTQLGPAPLFLLWLDSYDSVGSALSLAPLSLLTPSARSSAFEAAFSFTFLADACPVTPVTGRGFTFVLTSGPVTAVGPQNASSLGYGSAGAAFLKSVAVEFRLCPVPCIAVSSKGVLAGDGCAGAEFYTVLPPEKAFPRNTQQYAWVSYEGASQTLNVFLGGSSKVKPGVPALTAHVDIETILGATSASVGFTAGTWWGQDMASERHIIHQLSFVGGTFLETTNITAELTSAFAYSNETDLSLFTTTAPTPTPTAATATTTTTTLTDPFLSSPDALSTTGTTGGAAVLSELSPDATRGTVEFRFSAATASGPQSFVGHRRIVASRPVVSGVGRAGTQSRMPLAVLSELSPDATRGTVEFRFSAATSSGPQSFVGQRRIVASRPVVSGVGRAGTQVTGLCALAVLTDRATLSPDATRGTVEFRFTATTSSGPQSFVECRRIVASRPVVRAHVYLSNMEDSPMADVAVTARITYPNGTDASRCFVFSDPLLQGIDDVSGAGTLPSATSAGVDWLLLALDCAAPAAPTNFKFASTLDYTLPASSSAPASSNKRVELSSVRVTVVPSPKLQVHYFVPRHVQGDDLTTPQVEAPVPVTLAALFHNSGHGTAAAVATQSLLPTAATTTTTAGAPTAAGAPAAADAGATTTTGDTSSAAMSFSITSTVLGTEPQPASFSVKVGSIPPSATAMVRWTIEASLTGTFDTVTTTNTTTATATSSPLTGLSPILESVAIHNLVHVVYLPDAASVSPASGESPHQVSPASGESPHQASPEPLSSPPSPPKSFSPSPKPFSSPPSPSKSFSPSPAPSKPPETPVSSSSPSPQSPEASSSPFSSPSPSPESPSKTPLTTAPQTSISPTPSSAQPSPKPPSPPPRPPPRPPPSPPRPPPPPRPPSPPPRPPPRPPPSPPKVV